MHYSVPSNQLPVTSSDDTCRCIRSFYADLSFGLALKFYTPLLEGCPLSMIAY